MYGFKGVFIVDVVFNLLIFFFYYELILIVLVEIEFYLIIY